MKKIKQEKYEEVEFELTTKEYLTILSLAAKSNMTFNSYCVKLLKDYMDELEIKDGKSKNKTVKTKTTTQKKRTPTRDISTNS